MILNCSLRLDLGEGNDMERKGSESLNKFSRVTHGCIGHGDMRYEA
jgi:hypothetical protein